MIKVFIYEDEQSNIREIEVKDHANYADYGNDIVCAGVSMLTFTLINYLTEVAKLDDEQLEYEIDMKNVNIRVKIKCDSAIPDVKNGLEFYRVGIESLYNDYGENINLLYREV